MTRSKYDRPFLERVVALYVRVGGPGAAGALGYSRRQIHHLLDRARSLGIAVPSRPRSTVTAEQCLAMRRERYRRTNQRLGPARRNRQAINPRRLPWTAEELGTLDRCMSDGAEHAPERVAAETGRSVGAVRAMIYERKRRGTQAPAEGCVSDLQRVAVRGKNVDSRGLLLLLGELPLRRTIAA